MTKLNFRHPKYILPLVILPFLFLFFYVWQSSSTGKKVETKQQAGIKGTVGEVSDDIKKNQLADKLDAYRNTYKEADGNTVVSPIPKEETSNVAFSNNYSDKQKKMLDSVNRLMKTKYGENTSATKANDREMSEALKELANRQKTLRINSPSPKEKDPMEMFKQQMAYMDSMTKANDPAFKAEKQKREALAKTIEQHANEKALPVRKAEVINADFNTVRPERKDNFIMAVIDENITGYAGSRIRLRLLEDINAGKTLIKKGTYLYALVNGFSGQRVTFEIKTIFSDNKLLPVKLEVYDLDGLAGLYVPESAFRDFTKDLGTNSMQGVTIDGSSGSGSQFLMSSVSKIFESTSSAIAGMIRKNKAKIKYNSYLYLIDNEALQNAQNAN